MYRYNVYIERNAGWKYPTRILFICWVQLLVSRYCGKAGILEKDLSIDHVMPLSKGGLWTWENLVTACKPCNQKKADKTLNQIGWKMLNKPKVCRHTAFRVAHNSTSISMCCLQFSRWVHLGWYISCVTPKSSCFLFVRSYSLIKVAHERCVFEVFSHCSWQSVHCVPTY